MTRKQTFLVIFRVNSSTVVTIRGLKATEEGKPASVKVSFKVKKTGKASKYSYVSKVNVVEDKLTMTAAATKAKKITVTFNKAVDTTKAVIAVTKGAAKPTVTSTTFAADAKSAEIVMGTKLTEGTYTVTVTGLTDTALTSDITVENEKLTKFELVGTNLVADADATTVASISYKALNQYDEMMVADAPTVTCTFGNTKDTPGGVTAPTADKSGTITVANINTALAIPGTTGTIVLVDKSGVNLQTSVTYQSKAFASSATVYGIYSTKTEKLIEGNLSTGAKTSDYFMLMSVKDQYENDMTPAGIDKSKVKVSFTSAPILTDLKLADDEVKSTYKEVTYEGASAFLVPFAAGSDSGKLAKAGTLSITIVSGGKGMIANPSFTVDSAKVIKTLSVAPASTVYAGEDNVITVEAYDAAGNAITKYDDLKAAKLVATSDDEVGANKTLVLKKNADGTGTLYFKPGTVGNDDKNFKESDISTIMFTANDQTSTDYLVKTINVTVYEARQAWAVSGKTDKTVTACAVSRSLSLDLTTLAYEDQYSNTVKTDSAVAAALTGKVSIAIVDPDETFVTNAKNDATAKSVTSKIEGNNLVLDSIAGKGDATLFFRYKVPTDALATGDNGEASPKKYDLKLTISATNVGDMTASDLKLVVNNGNAMNASSDITFEASDVTNPTTHKVGDTKAPLYVTGVVNGKTVVIPSSQYHIVTKKIDKLGAYDAKNNDKTETKTVTVVVDSESGAQELTAEVTVSNKNSAITTVKTADDKGALGALSARTIKNTDLIKGIKVLDQYGNEMTNADQAAKFRYEVTLTGTSADWTKTITGDSTQDIEIVFAGTSGTVNVGMTAGTEITATVKYTTLDGKITFTQDVKCTIGS